MGQGKGESKVSAQRVATAERDAEACRLRVAGSTLEEIKNAINGIEEEGKPKYPPYRDEAHVYTQILTRIRNLPREAAEDIRTIELERLDDLQKRLWSQMLEKKDFNLVDKILKILDRRSKYLGLDADFNLREREVAIAEAQALMLEKVIDGALGDAGLDPEQLAAVREALPKHLRKVTKDRHLRAVS